MKRNITLLLLIIFSFFSISINAQTVYASLGSGAWNSGTQWETYGTLTAALAGAPGSGTASTSTSNPSGTHFVLIRSGHTITMGGANRGCKGIIIQNGGKLWANEAAARRLQIGAGGTGFTYPLIDTVQVDGTMGGSTDGIFIESGVNAQEIKISGSGTIDIQRLRMPGGAGSAFGGALTVNIDIDMNLWQAANYAFSAQYTPAATDNYTVNILPGRTVIVKATDGYFHSNSGSAFGNYTYNINGTLDLTASTQTSSNLSAFSSTGGTVNLNVNGTLKTGAALNSSPVSPGVCNLNIGNGGLVDATLASVMNFNGGIFRTQGTGTIRRTVPGDGSRRNYPVATVFGGLNTATISRENASGTPANYTVNVQNTFDNAPPNASECVSRQWNIAISGGTPSSADTLRLSWLTADQGGSFNPLGTVSIMHWNGASWDYTPASVTGTGSAADPYVARATGFTSYSPFGVTSSAPIPLSLLSFNASYNGQKVNINWASANEVNTKHFEIERSSDGSNYSSLGTVAAKNSAGNNNYFYADVFPLTGGSYYRLKMVDIDGRFKYSNVISLNTKIKSGLSVYPNPAVGSITINHGKLNDGAVISIVAADGKLIISNKVVLGAVQTTIDVSKLTRGTYRVIAGDATDKNSVGFMKQ